MTDLSLHNSYLGLPEGVARRVMPTAVAAPRLLALNAPLARQLGFDPSELRGDAGVGMLSGNWISPGLEPVALAYAGHQFGHFVPQLGDGRAILLGERRGLDGRAWDLQLKGAGRTPFSRGGDGRAALGPVLREYLVSDAMAALGVPTTRALAAVATGESVLREEELPGAVLTRVASSHLRIGTFQYFAVRDDRDTLAALVQYALQRHFPGASHPDGAAVALFDAVATAQAELVAHWMALGFVHGVLNTDNVAISGETLDYGPCAFLDAFVPDRSFSSIDRAGRYAYANQPAITQWNLARLAEALIPLVADGGPRALQLMTQCLQRFPLHFTLARRRRFGAKLGLSEVRPEDDALIDELLALMAGQQLDFTLSFRRFVEVLDSGQEQPLLALFSDAPPLRDWLRRWRRRLGEEPAGAGAQVHTARTANPAYLPRNHQVERVLHAAALGELSPFESWLQILQRPYDDQPDAEQWAAPPGPEQWSHRTFCGT